MFTKTFFTIFAITAILTTFVQIAKLQKIVMGGISANIANFPYQVLISHLDVIICGGSIIKPNFILSAAQCFNNNTIKPSTLSVTAGISKRYAEKSKSQRALVSLIIQHKQYNPETFDNDISILKLKKSLVFNKKVSAIRLPTQDQEFCGNGVITGWGGIWQNGFLGDELQQATLPIMPTTVCEWAWNDKFTSNMICAGWMDGEIDACQSDVGGPLARKGVLVGIASWGPFCISSEKPAVFTKVSVYRKFINHYINNKINKKTVK